MKYYLFLIQLWLSPVAAQQQNSNPYGLPIVSDIGEYRQACAADSSYCLVDLRVLLPTVVFDIRYATHDNFTGSVVYSSPGAYLRLPVARALERVQADLRRIGLGLKVFDAYRPYSATLKFWDLIGDTLYVAAPWKGSRHNRGCAVDVTLTDTLTGAELEMPTPFDEFSAKASPSCTDLPPQAIRNRELLIRAMERAGFRVMESEWWHFDHEGWEKYPLTDIPFSAL